MNSIRDRVLRRETVVGTWLNLGSSVTAEMAGRAGFDWVVIDVEHGAGDHESLLHQLQAVGNTPTCPLVRITWNELPRFKRTLDLGAAGIVIPYVTCAEEARQAVEAMRYPPQGRRGVAGVVRACTYSFELEEYLACANEQLLTVAQVETEGTLQCLEEIAAIDGIDVLFVGPMDLTYSLGIPRQYEHPKFKEALRHVSSVAKQAGKAAGILLMRPEQLDPVIDDGYTFIGLGSDGGVVVEGMKQIAATFQRALTAKKK